MANKRKRSAVSAALESSNTGLSRPRQRTAVPLPTNVTTTELPPLRRQPTRAGSSATVNANPNANPEVLDGLPSLRASPDGGEFTSAGAALKSGTTKKTSNDVDVPLNGPVLPKATAEDSHALTEDNPLSSAPAETHGRKGRANTRATRDGVQTNASDAPGPASETAADHVPDQRPGRNKRKKAPVTNVKVNSADVDNTTANAAGENVTASSGASAVEKDVGVTVDPEIAEGAPGENEDEEDVKEALSRPPPVNSDYLPLPWKGRLGYVRTIYLPSDPASACNANRKR